jgi:KTSC domain
VDRRSVRSRSLTSAGYDERSRTLEVEFTNGSIYQYLDVPVGVYHELLAAESLGRYLNEHIRNRYRYLRR